MKEEILDKGSELSCDPTLIPSAIEQIESLGFFAIGLLSFGTVLWTLNLYFALDACHNVLFQKESRSYKVNAISVLVVYPIAALCSLATIAIPRISLLSEAMTQAFLTISLYRLYLILIEIGNRQITRPPTLMLKVGPCCCCCHCIAWPVLDMNTTNLYWLELSILQLPIIQCATYCILLVMWVEEPTLVTHYGVYLQPLATASILCGIYGLTITTKSFQQVIPESELHHKTLVSQLVLLFSKLQGFIIKSLPLTGLFPCNPPISPNIYANVTYDSLMLFEMLLLSYAANQIYHVDFGKEEDENTLTGFGSTERTCENKETKSNINKNVQQQLTITVTA